MTTQEFSNEFDILYNNIMSNSAPGLNEYEKSVFLTLAQEAFVLDVYNGKYNENSFESTEEVSDYINTLVRQAQITNTTEGNGISKKSVFYQLPDDLWFITYESVILRDDALNCKNGQEVIVAGTSETSYIKYGTIINQTDLVIDGVCQYLDSLVLVQSLIELGN